MKICYIDKRFSKTSRDVIAKANAILLEYAAQGYDLTLRQLYYQFVARDFIPNKNSEYKKLGSIINDARLAGYIDWDHIIDRTRNLRKLAHWSSPKEIIESCASQYRVDKWAGQDNYVEVWVEKDALVGVLEVACDPLDVPYFSCRGYTSQSEMWGAGQRLVNKIANGKAITIIHLGDHDPSGIDMSRDIEDRLRLFIQYQYGPDIEFYFERIALNMHQIEEYQPPPNPAKLTDSRADGYIKHYGDESWELDSLEPSIITGLITDSVLRLRDEKKWKKSLKAENVGKAMLNTILERL